MINNGFGAYCSSGVSKAMVQACGNNKVKTSPGLKGGLDF
jgi:hypothetical protein